MEVAPTGEHGEEEAVVDEVGFSFEIPDARPGAILQVNAPDGVQLRITLPANIFPGDRMHMEKGANGKWGIKHVVRQEVAPVALVTSGEVARKSAAEVAADLQDPNVCEVQLDTTKGPIRLRIAPTWAPKGAQRFLQLVTDGYYTDVAIYRAVPGFLVQFGVVGDTERNSRYEAIQDDLLRGVPFEVGTVCFAAAGANTRTATICIFLDEFDELGKNQWETPIGKVVLESLPVLQSIFTGYGDMPQCGGNGPDPISLEEQGNSYITTNFPECDFVKSAKWLSP